MDPATPSPSSDHLRPARVVVASSDPATRSELEAALEPLGVIDHVADGETLASAVRSAAPDLVVYDARWPIVDALTALHALRAQQQTHELPVVLLYSGSTGHLARLETAEDASTEVLLAPFTPAELRARARAQLTMARQRAALAASEAELRASFETSSLGIVHVDPFTGVILRVNRRYAELFGVTERELLCTSYLALVPPEDRDEATLVLARIRESQGGLRTRRTLRRPDGTVVTVGVTSDVVRDAEGRPLRIVSFLEDLTVRDRLETELRASEERYRDLVEHAGAALVVLDEHGCIVELNPTAGKMFGSAIGAAFSTIAGDEETARRALALTSGEVRRESVQMRRADGTSFAAELTLRREQGRVQSIVRDMSEERDARRSETLLVTVADPVFVMNERGVIEYANAAAHRVFGYELGELIGIDHALLIPERFRASHAGHVERFARAPVSRPMMQRTGTELLGRRRDGSEFPIEVSLNPIATAAGPMVSTVVRDVTERRELERTARAQSDRLRAAIDAIPDVFAIWDREDRLAVFNAAYARLWSEIGVDIAVGTARGAMERRARSRSSSGHALLLTANEAGSEPAGEESKDITLDNGRVIRVNVRATPDGSRVMIGFDRTEDLRRELELEEARRGAEAANRAKTEFLASMSHELRTPLNAVLGFAQLLRRDARTPLTPRHREMVERILRGGEHLLRLVDDVLDLARIEARGVVIDVQPTTVSEAVDEVLETLAPLAREAGIELRSLVPPEPVHTLHVDRVRFVQILTNFGTNAIKYNRPGGSVTIDAARAGEMVRVVVSDTGMGVSTDERHNLFRPFHRAGQETGSIPGTGIGLTIARRLAEMMGGTVGYRPRLEGGSEFWVEVPARVGGVARDASSSQEIPSVTSARSLRGLRVLYVDDNEASLEIVRTALSTQEVEVVTASSAETGLALAQEQRPDVILMDVNMPGRDGFDALATLRTLDATRSIPVIALSAAASPADRQRGLAAGFFGYLTKPVRLEEVEAALRALVPARA